MLSVALIAHDQMKPEMINFARQYTGYPLQMQTDGNRYDRNIDRRTHRDAG
jgi:hypothetical protein